MWFLFHDFDMKIGIVGTHSVGKTTLVDDCETVFGIQKLRADKARTFAAQLIDGKRLNELSDSDQIKLQNKMKESLFDIQEKNETFIIDGCSITCAPYAKELISTEGLDQEWYNQLLEETVEHAFNNLDYILYIPEEIPLNDDGFRPVCLNMRTRIDVHLRLLLGINKLENGKLVTGTPHPKVRIICGTRDERLHQVSILLNLEHLVNVPVKHLYTFEGIPKSGKSTQINSIKHLPDIMECGRMGMSKEEKIKMNELYSNVKQNSNELMDMHINTFMGSQALYNVLDNIKYGKTVIRDRSRWTIIAMHLSIQGWENFSNIMQKTHGILCGNVIWFNVSPELANARITRTDDYELKNDLSFQTSVNSIYHNITAMIPTTYSIDASANRQSINRTLKSIVSLYKSFELLSDKCKLKSDAYLETGTPEWKTEDYLMDLSYQLGCINNSILKKRNRCDNHQLSEKDIHKNLAHDVVDVIYEIIRIANLENVNLKTAWEDKRYFDQVKISKRIHQ